MINDDHDDIVLLVIIFISKNWTITINIKENIMINRQNQLIAHPYIY